MNRFVIRPPVDPKGFPFDTFKEVQLWPPDPKKYFTAPLAPIYTKLEGERAPKKRDFFVKIFQKVPKKGAKKLAKIAYFSLL